MSPLKTGKVIFSVGFLIRHVEHSMLYAARSFALTPISKDWSLIESLDLRNRVCNGLDFKTIAANRSEATSPLEIPPRGAV